MLPAPNYYRIDSGKGGSKIIALTLPLALVTFRLLPVCVLQDEQQNHKNTGNGNYLQAGPIHNKISISFGHL